ncbi:MAG: hypothetical protein ACI4TU_09545 [Candidatus Cryptobacteroides sp.]
MKKFGLFLLKNNIHIMTLIFLGFAVMEAGVQNVFGNKLTDIPKLAKAMLKKRFGEKPWNFFFRLT